MNKTKMNREEQFLLDMNGDDAVRTPINVNECLKIVQHEYYFRRSQDHDHATSMSLAVKELLYRMNAFKDEKGPLKSPNK